MESRADAPEESTSDSALLARICARDSAALRALFQRYHAPVFAFVQRRLRDPELSEEVVADSFFEIWRSAERFEGASRISTWIFGIATFKAASAHRDRRRYKRASMVPTRVEALHAVPDSRDADADLDARERLRRLLAIVDGLPQEQREVMELALIDGLPYDEVARRLGIAEGTVKTRVARLRSRLRQRVDSRAPSGRPA